jgi:hypothetical protein
MIVSLFINLKKKINMKHILIHKGAQKSDFQDCKHLIIIRITTRKQGLLEGSI